MSRTLLLHFLLDEGTSVPREVGCAFFGLHTILFDFGGVVVDFGAPSFCFHTFSFFGGVGTTFGVSSFCFRLFFFGSVLFLFSLFFLARLSTSWGYISTSFMPCGFGPYLILIMEHCSYLGQKSNFSSLPLMLKWISLAPTSICAPAVLRNGRLRIRSDSFIFSKIQPK